MSLEIKKLEYQLAQVAAARMGMEIKIEELLQHIEKIKGDINKQLEREDELKKELIETKGV